MGSGDLGDDKLVGGYIIAARMVARLLLVPLGSWRVRTSVRAKGYVVF
jgi:hypothetical protein